MVNRRRSRKSHLAAAINSSSMGWQVFWAAVICIAIIVCFVLAALGK
jgi:hypothetical protein